MEIFPHCAHILQYHQIDDGSLFKTIRVQSSQLAETNLFAEEESSQCLCRALCSLGTTENTLEWPKLSLGKGLLYSYNIFKQMVEELQEVDPNAKDNFPRLHQTVARYENTVQTLGKFTIMTIFAEIP